MILAEVDTGILFIDMLRDLQEDIEFFNGMYLMTCDDIAQSTNVTEVFILMGFREHYRKQMAECMKRERDIFEYWFGCIV